MLTIDIVAIIASVVFVLGGIMLGFGKTLRLLTGGIVGKIMAIIACYFLFGIVLALPFVQNLLDKFVGVLKDNGSWYCKALLYVRIDLIVFAIALFFIVLLFRKILVKIIQKFFEMDNKPMRIINKVLGGILGFISLAAVALIVFQIIALIGGKEGDFYQSIQGSVFGIDALFKNNPLNSIVDTIAKAFKS
ncbi:MAG: hypothetical protein SPL13_00495 [Clostridia bacterium]|nr:hypothetical protein [Clostridia bacterium]